jgi:hypothetical protein
MLILSVNGKDQAWYSIDTREPGNVSLHANVDASVRRMGWSKKVYDWAEKHFAKQGRKLVPYGRLSPEAYEMWKKRDANAVKDYQQIIDQNWYSPALAADFPADYKLNEAASGPIPLLYHATPMYRYNPALALEVGVWPHDKPISQHGLIPSKASSLYEASIYLSDSESLAANYAANNFGEENHVDWVVLKIDPSFLDEAAFKPDLDQEAEIHFEEIMEMGYSEEDWWAGNIHWADVLHTTGQCRYTKAIPPSAISVVHHIGLDSFSPK